jgi:RND family efflux transporter MFP subunit
VDLEQTSLVKQARATLEEASANLERARRLVEQRLIARAEFDTAHATYVRAESALENAREEINHRLATLAQRRSELELAKQELADTTLKAPISGTVQVRHVSVGEYVGVGSPIAMLVRIDPLRLRTEIPEREAGQVQAGQLVRVAVDGFAGRVEGRVVRLAPGLAEQSRTLVVEAEIKNPGLLRPGSFVRAEIVHDGSRLALGVPPDAIVVFAGVEMVFVVEEGRAVERRVVTGQRSADFVEVLSGLSASDHVVAEPGNLQQGEAVSVAER